MSTANAGSIRAKLILDSSEFKKGLDESKRKLDESTSAAENNKKSLRAIERGALAVGVAVVASIGTSAKLAADFEGAMARVQGITQSTDAEMQMLENTARDLGATTMFSAKEAAEGI